MGKTFGRMIGTVAAMAMVFAWLALPPARAEALRIGTTTSSGYTYLTTEVAIHNGFLKKNGVDGEISVFEGGGKLEQAIISDSIDVAVSGGTDFAYIAKGVPEIAIAAMAGPPLALGVIVAYDSPMKTADDLKGKKIGVGTAGSLTDWLMHHLARQKGWAPTDITTVAVGTTQNGFAALATGQLDAFVGAPAIGFQMELSKRARVLFPASDIVHDFLVYAIFATNKATHDNPDLLRRFLKSWFENIAYMRANKATTVELLQSFTKYETEVQSKDYDLVMPMYSADGRFDKKALDVLAESFVESKTLPDKPDMSRLYTEAFLPGR